MSLKSLIKLAENPGLADLNLEFGEDPYDEVGTDGEGDYGDLSDTDDYGDDMGFDKGKSVKGPRTKLASAEEITTYIAQLAKSVNALAQVQKAMLEKAGWYDDDDGHSEEDEADYKTDAKPYENAMANKDVPSAKVSKDDEATTFGERDSTEPGNRPFDTENIGLDDTVLNDAPSSGPGPIGKAKDTGAFSEAQMRQLNRSIRQALDSSGVSKLNKSEGPAIGVSSKIEKGLDETTLRDGMKKLSWKEINQARAAMGDIPTGIL